jgi:hypothetical protein
MTQAQRAQMIEVLAGQRFAYEAARDTANYAAGQYADEPSALNAAALTDARTNAAVLNIAWNGGVAVAATLGDTAWLATLLAEVETRCTALWAQEGGLL